MPCKKRWHSSTNSNNILCVVTKDNLTSLNFRASWNIMNLPMLLTCELVNMNLRAIRNILKNILPHGQNIPFTWRVYYYHTGKIFYPCRWKIFQHWRWKNGLKNTSFGSFGLWNKQKKLTKEIVWRLIRAKWNPFRLHMWLLDNVVTHGWKTLTWWC